MTGNLYITVFPPAFTTAKYFPTEGNASNFLSNEMHRYFKTRETIHHSGHIKYPWSAKKGWKSEEIHKLDLTANENDNFKKSCLAISIMFLLLDLEWLEKKLSVPDTFATSYSTIL